MPVNSRLITVGAMAPSFTLPASGGREIALADYQGRRAVVLVFARGFF